MLKKAPARTAPRPGRLPIIVAVAVAFAAIVGGLGYLVLATSSPPSTTSVGDGRPGTDHGDREDGADDSRPRIIPGELGQEDGVIPEGEMVTVFDDIPAITNLEPDLLDALRDAAGEAQRDRIEFQVSSGWRSPEYQERLLRDAVADYGSEGEAARWVATATTSLHVTGEAIDIVNYDAISWLSQHGDRHGLCQIYNNEPWHYELRPEATDRGCPPLYNDPTDDPRMRQ